MLKGEQSQDAKILIIDDSPADIQIATDLLRSDGYQNIHSTTDPSAALALFRQLDPDVLLLDIHMPKLSGFNVMTQLLQDYPDRYLPIIIIIMDLDLRNDIGTLALAGGAQDFVTKPFKATELLLRVGNIAETHLLHRALKNQHAALEAKVKQRTDEIHESQVKLIACLTKAAEYKGTQTGRHVARISESCRILGKQMGLDEKWVDIIALASPMHDVGKIGIPDAVLLKPGKLLDSEWEVMKTHTDLGAEILADDESELLTAAASIAQTHHERWDGQGYPAGLTGEQIPLLTRIVTVCDVFDALTSQRPYKEAWPCQQALEFLQDNAGKQFDPKVVDEFSQVIEQVVAVNALHPDPPVDALTSSAKIG